MRSYAVFFALTALAVVLLISDALDNERYRTFNLVIVTIMFCAAALDLTLWMRHRRSRGQTLELRNLGKSA